MAALDSRTKASQRSIMPLMASRRPPMSPRSATSKMRASKSPTATLRETRPTSPRKRRNARTKTAARHAEIAATPSAAICTDGTASSAATMPVMAAIAATQMQAKALEREDKLVIGHLLRMDEIGEMAETGGERVLAVAML